MSIGFNIVEKVERVFVNLPDPFLKQTNIYPWHNYDILLVCKTEIMWVVKTLNKFVITKYVYT